MPRHFRMAVNAPRSVDAAEATVLTPRSGSSHSDAFQVTTLEAHKLALRSMTAWQPYMDLPAGRGGRADLLEKNTDTGSIRVVLLEKRVPVVQGVRDNLKRWLLQFVGNSAGINQLGGCKTLVQYSDDDGATWANYWTGEISRLRKIPAGWEVTVRDMANRLHVHVGTGRAHDHVMTKEGLGSMTSGSGVLTVPRAVFRSTDVGRTITVRGAGASGVDLVTTISTYTSATQVTLTATAGTTVTNTQWRCGYVTSSSLLPPGLEAGYGPHVTGPLLQGVMGDSAYFSGRKAITFVRNPSTAGLGLLASAGTVTQALLDSDVPVAEADQFQAAWIKYSDRVGVFFTTGSSDARKVLRPGAVLVNAKHLPSGGAALGGLVASGLEILVDPITEATDPDYSALPSDGTTVTFRLLPRQGLPPTEDAPMWWDDCHGVQILKDALDGYHGYLWTAAEKTAGYLPAGAAIGDVKQTFAYNASNFATLIADTSFAPLRRRNAARLYLDELLNWVCFHYHLTWRLNASGEIELVDLRLTDAALAGASTITDDDLYEDEGGEGLSWDYNGENGITVLQATYYEDYAATPATVPVGGVAQLGRVFRSLYSPNAELAQLDHPVLYPSFGRADLGERTYDLDLDGFRVAPGETYQGMDRRVAFEGVIDKLAGELRGPFGAGVHEIVLHCRLTANTDKVAGELVLVASARLPDPQTNAYGGTRALRVIERQDDPLSGGHYLRAIDLGPNLVASAPTIGSPGAGADTKHQVTVLVTVNGSGDPVVLQVALTPTSTGSAPGSTSPLWQTVARVNSSGTVTVSNLPAGYRVWVRGRSEPLPTSQVRLPSAWTVAASSRDLTALTAPSSLAAGLITQLSAQLTWTPGDTTAWTEFWLASPSTDTPVLIFRVPPGTSVYDLLGTTASATYKAQIRHADGLGGFSAFTSTTWTATGTPPQCPDMAGLAIVP